jgi:hypothetical protein
MAMFHCVLLFAQGPPELEWQRCLGGTSSEDANGVTSTTDGGYVLTGITGSMDGDVSALQGVADLWVVKLDSNGELLWERTYGGSNDERGLDIQQTMDGGFIVIGSTTSEDGDVTEAFGDGDIWVLKLDPEGQLEWQKSYGGSFNEFGYGIRQLSDGSYLMTGWTYSNDGTISGNHGGRDAWLAHIANNGDLLWQHCIGGLGQDGARSMALTSDGAVVIAGWSNTNAFPDEGAFGPEDLWVVKLNLNGVVLWERFFGGPGDDQGWDIMETMAGELIVVGQHESPLADSTTWQNDAWVLALDPAGQLLWDEHFGGSAGDYAFAVGQYPNGDLVVAGLTQSSDGDVSGYHGSIDGWLFSLNEEHELLWQRSIGGTSDELVRGLVVDPTGSIVVAGRTYSNDGDISGNHGSYDVLAMKFGGGPIGIEEPAEDWTFTAFPNPASDHLTVQLDLPRTGAVELEIFDVSGRMAMQLSLGRQQHLRKQLDIGALAKGVYQVVLRMDGKSVNRRFIKS